MTNIKQLIEKNWGEQNLSRPIIQSENRHTPLSDLLKQISRYSPLLSKKENLFATVDQALDKLEFGNIAFNTPVTINLNDTAVIQLLLDLEAATQALKKMIEAEGEKESARIQVSDRMEARLSGHNFAISAITPETQAIAHNTITEWKWEVSPKIAGRQHLHLTLSLMITIEGEPALKMVRTFDKEITVEVTVTQKISSFLKQSWQWLWAAILVPIAGWLWKQKKNI